MGKTVTYTIMGKLAKTDKTQFIYRRWFDGNGGNYFDIEEAKKALEYCRSIESTKEKKDFKELWIDKTIVTTERLNL